MDIEENAPKKHKRKIIVLLAIGLLLFVVLSAGVKAYEILYKPNVHLTGSKPFSLEIKTASTWQDVQKQFRENHLLRNTGNFFRAAKLMKYPESIKPGRYFIKAGMNNLEIIRKLRSGNQDPVRLTFNNARTKEDLAGKIAKQLEFDSVSLLNQMNDPAALAPYDVTPNAVLTLFIPNTYELFWNTTPKKFLDRMYRESQDFWNEKREEKRRELGFSRLEVITLASIVEKETNKNDEKQDMAGVYINRLQKGMLLQADPTLVFASGDFGLKRVLNVHKKIDSPYNTYMYKGLPPGPIYLPSISSIDAVLNYHKHNYLFFCAREDFSGYHNFAATLAEHSRNRDLYIKALNERGIK